MGEAVGGEYRIDRVVIANTAKANEPLHFAKAYGKQARCRSARSEPTAPKGGAWGAWTA